MTSTEGNVVQIGVPTFHVDIVIRDNNYQQFAGLMAAKEHSRDRLAAVLQNGLDISADQLFGYAICQELGNLPGRRTRQELASRIPGLRGFVMRDFPPDGGPLRLTGEPGEGVVEYIGVDTGLALVDYLLELDSSYFRRISELRKTGQKPVILMELFEVLVGAPICNWKQRGGLIEMIQTLGRILQRRSWLIEKGASRGPQGWALYQRKRKRTLSGPWLKYRAAVMAPLASLSGIHRSQHSAAILNVRSYCNACGSISELYPSSSREEHSSQLFPITWDPLKGWKLIGVYMRTSGW